MHVSPWLIAPWLLAQQVDPPLRRLDPVSRTKVMMALLALLLLGALLLAVVVLWTRYVKRRLREPLPGRRAGADDEWYNKPLVPKAGEEDDQSDDEPNDDERAP